MDVSRNRWSTIPEMLNFGNPEANFHLLNLQFIEVKFDRPISALDQDEWHLAKKFQNPYIRSPDQPHVLHY